MKAYEILGRITLTGVDESTDLSCVQRLLDKPHVEIAFLYSGVAYAEEAPRWTRRYVSSSFIRDHISGLKGNLAIHICGGESRRELLEASIEFKRLLAPFQRIQFNGKATEEQVKCLCASYPDKTIITQHTEGNATLSQLVGVPNHALLVDDSSGKGIPPTAWTRPETLKNTGHAGGLGPQNICAETSKILGVAKPGAWLDMEGKLRNPITGWFIIENAEASESGFAKSVGLH